MSSPLSSVTAANRLLEHVEGPSFLLHTGNDEILNCNDRGARFLGYRRSELRGGPISRVHPDETETIHEAAVRARNQVVCRRDGLTCLTKTGEEITADISILDVGREAAARADTPTTPDTTSIAMVHTERDESRRARQIAGLLRILRHNVRNRLNVVIGHLEAIERETDDEGDSVPTRHAEAALAACEDLLDTTANTWEVREVLQTNPEHDDGVDVVPLVESAVDTVSAAHSEARFQTWLPESIDVVGTGLLELAVRHVVENAVVHSDATAPRVWIVVRPPPAVDGECVEVVVGDRGPGIPAAERRVTQRETPPTPVAHASGLGLWITAWLVRRSCGSVDIETGPDGTTVTLRLPADDTDDGDR